MGWWQDFAGLPSAGDNDRDPDGRAAPFAMRGSGPMMPAAPVAPVVSRTKSSGSRNGSSDPRCNMKNTNRHAARAQGLKGGDVIPALLGAPPKVGTGRVL